MKTKKKQKRNHLTPDPEVILKINRDGKYFKGIWVTFNIALFIACGIFLVWLLQ